MINLSRARKVKETVTLCSLCFTISDSDGLPFPSILSLEACKMLSGLFLSLINGQDHCLQSKLILQMTDDLMVIIEIDLYVT